MEKPTWKNVLDANNFCNVGDDISKAVYYSKIVGYKYFSFNGHVYRYVNDFPIATEYCVNWYNDSEFITQEERDTLEQKMEKRG